MFKIENKTAIALLNEIGQRLGTNLLSGLENQLDKDEHQAKKWLANALVADAIMRYDNSVGATTTVENARKEASLKYADVAEGPWPPWAVLWDVYAQMKKVSGKELVEFVEIQTRTMDQISKADDDTIMAVEMEKNHILGIGMLDGKAASEEYVILMEEAQKSGKLSGKKPNKLLLKAIKKGIKKAGRKNIYIMIALILASFILWLAMGNTKQVLGMVANATEEDLYTRNWEGNSADGVSDVWMNCGKMTSYMTGYYPPDYDKNLAIPYSYIFEDELEDSIIWCGGFFMEKKFGFYGAEGIFLLHTEDQSLTVATIGACPYSNNNRTWIQGVDQLSSLDSKDAKKELFREMYNHNAIHHTTNFKGYELYSRLGSKGDNAQKNGHTAMCVTIQQDLT